MFGVHYIALLIFSMAPMWQTTVALKSSNRHAGIANSFSSLYALSPLVRPTDVSNQPTSTTASMKHGRHSVFLGREGQTKVTSPIVICGPSGVGKGTLIGMLLERYGNQMAFAVSHTTRHPREGEVDGREYNFVTHEKMEESIRKGEFIEFCEVHKNFYGTSIQAVSDIISSQQICILDLDTQGVQSLKALEMEEQLGFPVRYVFIAPPSIEHLRTRLTARGTETREQVQGRLSTAEKELTWFQQNHGVFDAVVVNDDLKKAVRELDECVIGWNPDFKT